MMKAPIRLFLEAMYEAEHSADGPPLRVQVKYRGDATSYEEWSPVRLNDITEEGLLDPGFGSGPVSYSKIEQLVVPLVSRQMPSSSTYTEKITLFARLAAGIPGAKILRDAVIFD
jgi:hypothetical protein